MKSTFTIVLFLIACNVFAQKSRTHFKTDIDFGNGTVFTTFLDANITQQQFTIT